MASHIPRIHISKLIPSMVTLMALCLGLTSIRYGLDQKWTAAAALILFAAVLDGIDGRLARLLNSSSKFGAELDSLSDLVAFGVAPAITMYFWALHEIPYKGVGWSIVLFYVACSALRLARFNSALDDSADEATQSKSMEFFVGIPMPAGALLVILPMVTTFELFDYHMSYWAVAAYMVVVGALMVSKLPTFSGKQIHVSKEYVSLIMILAAVLIAAIILEPWLVLPMFGFAYIAAMPYVWWKKHKKKH